jgi:threonine dehydrogenase-like Zn-dependent dehydrogenase
VNKLKVNALVIEPLKKVYFKDIFLSKKNKSDVKIDWAVSSVCNSERRRYNLTKSAFDDKPFIGGHEAVGYISEESYPKKRYALLPHSNCLTRNDPEKCISCENQTENLCKKMRHAGLDNNEPSGFSDMMFVNRSQLFDVSDIKLEISSFLEPLSCVVRSWNLTKANIKNKNLSVGIIGGGPIGCLHALYLNQMNNKSEVFIIESSDSKREILKDIFKEISNVKILDNSISDKFDITVMASSSSSGFEECSRLLKPKGKLILFSGFNNTNYQNESYLPEIIHRNEFIHFAQNSLLIGSSGYTEKDLIISKKMLQNFDNLNKIITGKVYGLNSKVIHRYDGTLEEYNEPVLIKDIKGDFNSSHIKIQYFNEN